MLAAVAVRGA